MNKREALAEFLEVDVEEIIDNGSDEYSYGDAEYLVLSDDEADSWARERIAEDLEGLGVECCAEWVFEDCFDDDMFRNDIWYDISEWVRESPEDYLDWDYNNMYYDLIRSLVDEILLDDDVEELVGYSKSDYEEMSEWEQDVIDELENMDAEKVFSLFDDYDIDYQELIDNITDNYIDDEILNNPIDWAESMNFDDRILYYVDEDCVADKVIGTDGRGHVLASYDGVEEECCDYYIYRIN